MTGSRHAAGPSTVPQVWSLLHVIVSGAALAVVGASSVLSWSESETLVVLTFPVSMTFALVLATGAWVLAPVRLVPRVLLRAGLVGALGVFAGGSLLALVTWWKGFDFIESPDGVPPRLEQLGDVGYAVGHAGFLAVLAVSALTGVVAALRRRSGRSAG